MSRRPLLTPVEQLAKAQSRMAPGGLLWSESPIPRRHTPRVPMAGEEPAAPGEICVDLVVDPDGHTYRPASGTFTAPTGTYWGTRLVLVTPVPWDNLRHRFYTPAGVLGRTIAVFGGPWAAGASVVMGMSLQVVSPAPEWGWMTLSYGSDVWATASSVRFCYTTIPPGG